MFSSIKAWFVNLFDKNADGKIQASEVAAVAKEEVTKVAVEVKNVAVDAAKGAVQSVKQGRKTRKSSK
jgi:Ca2+-binding EF-hand superfamily protein